MALSADRNTKRYTNTTKKSFPVKGSTTIYKGGLTMLNAGYAVPASTALNLTACGRACQQVANTGADGAKTIEVEEGIFWFTNGDSIAQADVGKDCYATDDATVAKTNLGTKSKAGKIVAVDSTLGVAVQISFEDSEIDANPLVQKGTGTLTLGVLTVSTGITVTANSVVLVTLKTPAGVFSDGGFDAPSADRVVGGPGTGTIVIRALVQAGTANTSDTSTVDYLIVG